MQAVIKEYGETIIASVVTVLIIALVFGGLAMIGKLGTITGEIDRRLVQEAEASSETALKKHMDIRADNIDMSGNVPVVCGKKIYYEQEDSDLIGMKSGGATYIYISHVYLLTDYGGDNEGYDVTDQVLDREGSFLKFDIPGNYRLVVNINDRNRVESDYQLFVTAVERRG